MSPRISRRELLKGGAKAAAALSVLPALTGEAEAQRGDGARRRPAGRGVNDPTALLGQFAERHMREVGAPGMTLSFVIRDGGAVPAGFGFADKKAGARVTPETSVRDRLHLEVVRGRRAVADA